MKLTGLSEALTKARTELIEIETARAGKMTAVYHLVQEAERIAEAMQGAVSVERTPYLKEKMTRLIDKACEIEAEIGIDKIGRVADAHDVPLKGVGESSVARCDRNARPWKSGCVLPRDHDGAHRYEDWT